MQQVGKSLACSVQENRVQILSRMLWSTDVTRLSSGAVHCFPGPMGRRGKGRGQHARRLLGVRAKAAALGKDHFELAFRAEEMQAAAMVTSISDAIASWDRQSLEAATKVTQNQSRQTHGTREILQMI